MALVPVPAVRALAGAVLLFLPACRSHPSRPSLEVSPEQPLASHDGFVSFTVRTPDTQLRSRLSETSLFLAVFRSGVPVMTIGRRRSVRLRYHAEAGEWRGRWPCPWNAPEGEYRPHVWARDARPGLTWREKARPFRISGRRPAAIPPDVRVLTMEEVIPLKTPIKGPDGRTGDWRRIFDWVEFAGANTYWTLGAETAGYGRRLTDADPWLAYADEQLRALGREAHRRGKRFGVWVVGYLTFGSAPGQLRYRWAVDYSFSRGLFPTRAISLADEKRISDLARILKRFNRVPEVDFVGIDYIRNALGGYELVDEFVRDMEPGLPRGWERYDLNGRMTWLAHEKIARKNRALIDQWQWWRAQKVAGILRRIKAEAGLTKPFWCYTLSWEKGWQHGQDPVMMNDAAADLDAVMLYEANREQYDQIVKDWHAYVSSGDAALVVGNVIDWPLHQSTVSPSGPEEFLRRTMLAVDHFYRRGPVRGVFLHDLGRGLWGRRGPYSSREWFLAGASALSGLGERWGTEPIRTTVRTPKQVRTGAPFEVEVRLDNTGTGLAESVVVNVVELPGLSVPSPARLGGLPAGASRNVRIPVTVLTTPGGYGRASLFVETTYSRHAAGRLSPVGFSWRWLPRPVYLGGAQGERKVTAAFLPAF